MRYEDLLEPIDDDSPCGPDLDLEADGPYFSYIFAAEGRLPSRFFSDDDKPFDRSTLDLKTETKTILELLKRSRDLRLLVLDAQFNILAGNIVEFCDDVALAAGWLEKFWDSVHPGADGDFGLRMSTLESLDSLITCVLPSQYVTLVRDRRDGNLTLRNLKVAKGEETPLEGELNLSSAAIMDAIGAAGATETVTATYEAIVRGLNGFDRIKAAFVEHGEEEPTFDRIVEALGILRAVLLEAKPDLDPDAQVAAEGDADVAEDDAPDGESGDATAATSAGPSTVQVSVVSGDIATHGAARAALKAVEAFFASREPTSPTLLLVHQACELIGQPLVVAMDQLMPNSVATTLINFDSSLQLQLDIDRMRQLTSEISYQVEEDPDADFTVEHRPQATQLISDVEAFFRAAEPSSPIPLLLQKARGYMNRDFAAIMADITPKEDDD